jgi:predicted transcriptional regulator
MNRLGELERAIMEVLWQSPDPMTVRQVGICLTDRDLAHTTVMTVLDRLTKKGFVRRQRAGRAWRYRPAESREAYVAELMLTALDQTGDRQAALTRFARSVSGSEAHALRVALEALAGSAGSVRADEHKSENVPGRGGERGHEPDRGDLRGDGDIPGLGAGPRTGDWAGGDGI